MSIFEDLIDEVVEKGLSESAVVSYYFLANYPYSQGHPKDAEAGEVARKRLHTKFHEIAPPRWVKKRVGKN